MVLILLAHLLIVPMAASAQNGTTDRDLQKLRDRIAALEKKVAGQSAQEEQTIESIDALDEKISLTKNLIAKLGKQIRTQQRNIRKLDKSQASLDKRLERLKKNYSRRLISLYKYGQVPSLQLLLDATSAAQVEVWSQYQRRLAEQDARQITAIRSTSRTLVMTRDSLRSAFRKEQKLVDESIREEKQLSRDQQDKKKRLAAIRRDKSAYLRQIENYRREIEQIRKLIAASEETAQKIPMRDPMGKGAPAPFGKMQGKLPWPARGEVIRPYGEYRHPVLKTVTDNLGIDIAVPAGAPVRAVAPGRVTAITWQRGRGNLIIINHDDGYYSVYTHIDEILVDMQEDVRSAQLIGRVGQAGNTDTPVLHFQIWQRFEHLDPSIWLGEAGTP